MTYGIFDAHCDTLTTLGAGDNLYDVKRDFNFKQVEGYDYFTQVMALWVDIARDGEKVDDKVQTFIKRFYVELEKNPSVKHIKTKEDIANLQKGSPSLKGVIADLIKLGKYGKHFFRCHSRCDKRLVRIAENCFCDLYLCHFIYDLHSV